MLKMNLGQRRYCSYKDSRGFSCSNEVTPREDMSLGQPTRSYCDVHRSLGRWGTKDKSDTQQLKR